VAAAVAELLGVPAPGRDDDLLALGADSLVVGSLAAGSPATTASP
jgi:hypothetical protein